MPIPAYNIPLYMVGGYTDIGVYGIYLYLLPLIYTPLKRPYMPYKALKTFFLNHPK